MSLISKFDDELSGMIKEVQKERYGVSLFLDSSECQLQID